MDEREKEAKRFENIGKTEYTGIMVRNPEVDMAYIQSDSSRIARNDNWVKNVPRDFQLNEAMHIMYDLIAQEPKFTQKGQ